MRRAFGAESGCLTTPGACKRGTWEELAAGSPGTGAVERRRIPRRRSPVLTPARGTGPHSEVHWQVISIRLRTCNIGELDIT